MTAALERAALDAVDLAPTVICAVHDTDRPTIADLLAPMDRQQLYALVIVLAAAFDPDQPLIPAIEWVSPEPTERSTLRPCGTHSAFARHKAAGEEIDHLCRRGERDYQHAAYLKRLARRRTASDLGATA